MTPPFPVMVETAVLRAIATVNGTKKCQVFLYRREQMDQPVAVETFDLASSEARAAFLAPLAGDVQADAEPLLLQLAAACADAASRKKKDKAAEDPFPAIEPWDQPVAGAELLDDLAALVCQYLVLPEHAAKVIALWVVHTYVISASEFTPYLGVTSPVRECGKSTLLDLLVSLAYRAQLTGGITAAALYRRIARHSPTMLLDELDTRLHGDSGELLRGVLNTGFHRSGRITICVGDDHHDEDFATFGPKVLAGIGRLWDTVASRSIPVRLARATKEQLAGLTKIRGDRIGAECYPFRRRCYRFAEDARDMLRIGDPVTPAALSARQADVWRPLLAVADLAGDHWPDTARSAALALHGIAEEEGDYGLLALQDVASIFATTGQPIILSTDIVKRLCAMEERPWPEYRRGNELSPRGLASLLGRFGIKPRTHRLDAGTTGKGYALTELQRVFDIYLPPTPPELSVTSVTSGFVTDVTDTKGGCGGERRRTMISRSDADAAVADAVLTPLEVARWLKIKPRQLDRLGVPCLRLGHRTHRYLRADVQRWLEGQRAP